jgi:hypothetical protein
LRVLFNFSKTFNNFFSLKNFSGQPPPTMPGESTIPTAPTGPGDTTTPFPTVPTPSPTDVPTEAPPTDIPTEIPTDAPPTNPAPPTDPPQTTSAPFQCPPTGIHTLPHPEFCELFFTCVNGNPISGICPHGQLFDAIRGSCEPSAVVDCGSRIRP